LVLRPHLDDATEQRLEAEVKAELDDAVEFARSSPYPSPEEALEDVYA
jgi:pyruvate dehydrogenase E1 component alpha subunit